MPRPARALAKARRNAYAVALFCDAVASYRKNRIIAAADAAARRFSIEMLS